MESYGKQEFCYKKSFRHGQLINSPINKFSTIAEKELFIENIC
jgi:hypothetical protein